MGRDDWRLLLRIGCFMLVATLLIACNNSTVNRPERSAFKGMELYSWRDQDGEWLFSILVGTNRIKSVSEVQEAPMGINEVRQRFCEMAVGEHVMWMTGAVILTSGEYSTFPLPPEDVIAELKQCASLCNVELLLYER